MAKKMTPLEAVMASLAGVNQGKGVQAGGLGASADTVIRDLNKALGALAERGPGTTGLRTQIQQTIQKLAQAAQTGTRDIAPIVAEGQALLGRVSEQVGGLKFQSARDAATQANFQRLDKKLTAKEADAAKFTAGRKAETEAQRAAVRNAERARVTGTEERFANLDKKLAEKEAGTAAFLKERGAAKEAEQAAISAERSGKIADLRKVFKDTVGKEAKIAELGKVRGGLFKSLEPLIGGKWGETAAKVLPELAIFALISKMTGLFDQNQKVDEAMNLAQSQGMSTDDYLEEMKNQRAAMARAAGMANGNQQAMQAMLQQMTPPGEVMFGTVPQQGGAQGAGLQDILGQLAL